MNRNTYIPALIVTAAMALGWYAQYAKRTEAKVEPSKVEISPSQVIKPVVTVVVDPILPTYDSVLKNEKSIPPVSKTAMEIMLNAKPAPRPPLFTISTKIGEIDEAKKAKELEYVRVAMGTMPAGADVFAGEDLAKSVECLARNVFKEARGESVTGQAAIAFVTLNRTKSRSYPNTVCEVVYQKACTPKIKYPVYDGCTAQFTWTWDGLPDKVKFYNKKGNFVQTEANAWANAIRIAVDVLRGNVRDFTGGAMYYYNYKLSDPRWARSEVLEPMSGFPNGIIGDHRFMVYKDTNNVASK